MNDRTSENYLLGTCSLCDRQAVVAVNGTTACREHLDEVMSDRLSSVRNALKKIYPSQGSGSSPKEH